MDDKMRKLYSCVICTKLFDEATALNGCRHIFCWKCIHGKITEHAWHCCPICYADLGPDPLRRLRFDDPLLLTMERENLLSDTEDEEAGSDDDYMEESESSDEDEDEETDSDDGLKDMVIDAKGKAKI
ncbi:PREDICTED: E3 ubiquitin protein ligase DRIP1-like [Camelina sativa]|uniref:E3 ubiquitin protein ligase DRIP1-like n=1 Tax=Camelina sativa TaxID=90675 RepID=A0ABM1RGX1_CAMSA|nr:PREDICTED: E3 ubiquitin protein ligase DRIP1-like [Camelina sativa]XP_019098259.1 PREDICTED: E3 ubiquitin protein ligase DRIP1-like [Camelina sativa]